MNSNTEDLHREIARLKEEIASLKKNNQLSSYKLLLECSPDIILQVDADYNVVVAHLPDHPVEKIGFV